MSVSIDEISSKKIHLFKLFHLFYEDLKVDSTMGDTRRVLNCFLFSVARFLGVKNSQNYLDFYSRDYPTVPFRFNNDDILSMIDNLYNNKNTNGSISTRGRAAGSMEEEIENLPEKPISIESVIRNCLRTKPSSTFIFKANELSKFPLPF